MAVRELTLQSTRNDSASDFVICRTLKPASDIAGSFTGSVSQSSFTRIDPSIHVPIVTDSLDSDGDAAFYGVGLQAGTTYSISLRGTGADPLDDSVLALYDTSGQFITLDDDGGATLNSLMTFTPEVSGTYFLGAFQAYEGAGTGQFTIDVNAMGEDSVPGTLAGAVAIGEGTTFSFIEDSSTDLDVYAVNLTEGLFYSLETAGGADYTSDYLNLPQGELDTLIGLYDAEGNLVATNDDTNFGDGDVGSTIGLVAPETGTYYLAVQAYDNLTTGDPQVGGYTVTVSEGVDPSTLDPLDSIDWVNADNVDFVDVDGTPTAYVYFAHAGESFGELADNGEDPLPSFGWSGREQQQVMLALEEFEHILGVNYEVTTDVDQATFRIITTTSDQYGAYFYPQDPVYGDAQGIGAFNVNSGGWDKPGFSTQDIPGDQVTLDRGGFAFGVILHEFGHAHGLAHPHDHGGGSDIMLGVTGPTGSYGAFNLDQGVYTVMSYNDAWDFHPDGPSPFTISGIDNGWSATLSAFDIAQLQERYGVHEYQEGNDVYTLADAEDDAFYQTIWDSGGTDAITYSGDRDAQIDLMGATLDYSPTGGGALSFVDDIHGGYTIANGAVIENASGGRGNDGLLGNEVANLLVGNNGDDVLMGRAGDDTLSGGNGEDTLAGGDGNDLLDGGNNDDVLSGDAGNDTLRGGNSTDVIEGNDGNDTLDGGNSDDILVGGAGDDTLRGGNSADVLVGGAGDDTLIGGNGGDSYGFTDAGTDTIVGYQSGETIDFSGLLGVDSDDISISGNSIFVDLEGDDDLTIFVQGDSVHTSDIVFAPTADTHSNPDQYTAMIA